MMDRRLFLTSSAGALMAQSGAERIRIAFLGASHAHAAAKLDTLRQSARFELAGVVDEDPAVRARCEKAGIALLSRDAVLADRSIPVVAVESGVPYHARDARMALDAGKHVHLEKPPATDMKSFRDLVARAASKKRLLQLGYMWRHNPGINAAMDAARKGWLGDVYMVRGTIGMQVSNLERPALARYRGGQMFELGCHLIDPVIRLLGSPTRVIPVLKHHGSQADSLADNTVAVFEFPRALGIVMSPALQPGANRHRAFEVFGSNGNAVVEPLEQPLMHIDLAAAAGPYRAGIQKVQFPPYRRYVDDFNELADAIQMGRPLSVTPEEDLRVQQAVLGAASMA